VSVFSTDLALFHYFKTAKKKMIDKVENLFLKKKYHFHFSRLLIKVLSRDFCKQQNKVRHGKL